MDRLRPFWIGLLSIWLLATAITQAEEPILEVCARPNYGFLTQENGQAQGFELDLLETFAQKHGLSIELHWSQSFQTLMDDVAAGRCDIASSAITITEARRAKVDFSSPYFPVLVVVVAPASQLLIGPGDLAGLTVAVVGDTQAETVLRDLDPSIEIATTNDDASLLERVRDGEAEALVCDSVTALHLLRDGSDLRVKMALSDRQAFGFALPKGSPWTVPLSAVVDELRRDPNRLEKWVGRHFPSDLIPPGLFDFDD